MSAEILQVLLSVLTDPTALGLSVIGTLLGIILGALPGVSSTMALAVLLPLSFSMSPLHGMIFLMGIFSASVYGGSISAILVNIPGTPGAIVTQMDGYPMAQKGRAGEALMYALLASTFGGILGWLLLVFLAPMVADAALHFQSPEYAAVTFFGLTMLAYATPGSTFKALVSGTIGLVLATVGLDEVTGAGRFDFGNAALQSGISIIPVAVGIFGLAEVLRNIEGASGRFEVIKNIRRLMPPWSEMRRLWPMAVRGSVIGAFVGAIPAAGSAIGVTVAYAQEKRMSKHPERYGTGIPEGIVAPESANNACVGGALVPMMTLGIPGDSMTAVLIGALLIHGLRPGPQLFTERSRLRRRRLCRAAARDHSDLYLRPDRDSGICENSVGAEKCPDDDDCAVVCGRLLRRSQFHVRRSCDDCRRCGRICHASCQNAGGACRLRADSRSAA